MKRILGALSCMLATATIGLGAAAPAQAACGEMDLYRDPSTFVFLYWSTGSGYTRIEPHGGSHTMRAEIARYQSGVHYYYGPYVFNPYVSGTNRSYVSATNGTRIGGYYSFAGDLHNGLYNDYGRCKPGV